MVEGIGGGVGVSLGGRMSTAAIVAATGDESLKISKVVKSKCANCVNLEVFTAISLSLPEGYHYIGLLGCTGYKIITGSGDGGVYCNKESRIFNYSRAKRELQ